MFLFILNHLNCHMIYFNYRMDLFQYVNYVFIYINKKLWFIQMFILTAKNNKWTSMLIAATNKA